MQRNLTDADLLELRKLLEETHKCPFSPESARILNEIAETAKTVKQVSISSVVRGVFYLAGLLLLLGIGYWVRN